MRVDNVYSAYKIYNTNGAGRQRRAGSVSGQQQEAFTMSVQAGDYNIARKAVSQISDVRWDRVEALQTQIESGSYNVSPAMVADKILRSAYGLD